MFRRYLLRRINAPGNGVLTDPEQLLGGQSSGLSRIEYRIGTDRGEEVIQFGVVGSIGVTGTSYSATVGRLVGYGRELLSMGARYVVVGLYDRRVVCTKESRYSREYLGELLEWLFPRLSLTPREGFTGLRLELPEVVEVWFDRPTKPSLRSLYLANANQVLSVLCNTTVQFGLKPIPAMPNSPQIDVSRIRSWDELSGMGVPTKALTEASKLLYERGVRTYLESQSLTTVPLDPPTVVYALQVGTLLRELPLWGKVDHATLVVIQKLLARIPCKVSVVTDVYDLSS